MSDLYEATYAVQRAAGEITAAANGRDARFVGGRIGLRQHRLLAKLNEHLTAACWAADELRKSAFPTPTPKAGTP